jgi:hypothetical protein
MLAGKRDRVADREWGKNSPSAIRLSRLDEKPAVLEAKVGIGGLVRHRSSVDGIRGRLVLRPVRHQGRETRGSCVAGVRLDVQAHQRCRAGEVVRVA